MSDGNRQIARNVPNFIPMGQAGGERVKQDEAVDLDAEGKPINPHIPQFISKAPWYLDSGAKSSLKHQRLSEKDSSKTELKNDWYRRGERAGPAATKYRKGACENCGASTHKTKDCLERPRKLGAKWSGRDIQADEIVQEIETTWDSKRDRANGYDFDDHALTLKANFDRIEALRAERGDILDKDESDELNPQSVADQTKSNSNSHMRIREDTASYLAKDHENDSYDPKTRKMKGSTTTTTPSAGTSIDKQNFTRGTNDARQFEKLQAFSWSERPVNGATPDPASSNNGKDLPKNAFGEIHAQATPSQAALQFAAQTKARELERANLLSKYGIVRDSDPTSKSAEDAAMAGGDSTVTHLKPIPLHLLETSAHQPEYSRDGKLVTKKQTIKSQYPGEDLLIHGHSTVWGSWYDVETGAWGYQCCRNTLKNAYCTAQ